MSIDENCHPHEEDKNKNFTDDYSQGCVNIHLRFLRIRIHPIMSTLDQYTRSTAENFFLIDTIVSLEIGLVDRKVEDALPALVGDFGGEGFFDKNAGRCSALSQTKVVIVKIWRQ